MGIFKIQESEQYSLYIWQVTESEEELKSGVAFREATQARYDKMQSAVHRKGFLAVRQLLLVAGYTDFDLLYDSNGKPYLTDGNSISISHSFEYACIIISKQNVGIDIEQKRDKIKRIAPKFLNSSEVEFQNTLQLQEEIDYLTRVWCAKETLFKMCDSRSLSFKDNMLVQLESYNTATVKAFVEQDDFKLAVTIHIIDLESFVLAYAIE